MSNFNKKYKQVLNDYDIESIEIDNYDLFAKLKDKIKKEKSNKLKKSKESKMVRKSKTDTILEVVLNLKEEFSDLKTRVVNLENNFNDFKKEIKIEFNNFKTEVKEEFSKVNSRLDKLENDVKIIKYEATKHGWNV